MTIRKIAKSDLEKDSSQIWNAFIDLLATENYEDLNVTQRIAHLCFWYDSEVNNGGHFQYFENKGGEHLNETIDALRAIGGEQYAGILKRAGDKFLSKKRKTIRSVFEFVHKANEEEFSIFDDAFYAGSPTISDLLESFLAKNMDQFIEII